jgi:hypothetical protein
MTLPRRRPRFEKSRHDEIMLGLAFLSFRSVTSQRARAIVTVRSEGNVAAKQRMSAGVAQIAPEAISVSPRAHDKIRRSAFG